MNWNTLQVNTELSHIVRGFRVFSRTVAKTVNQVSWKFYNLTYSTVNSRSPLLLELQGTLH